MSDDLPNAAAPGLLCDMCAEEDRKAATKTCMKCEISRCTQHLMALLITPHQTHPLTEPMALSGATKCPQHGKLLEYYCLDDLTCVCVSCAIEDQHRPHNMKTFSTAHRELAEKLEAELGALGEANAAGEGESLEKWEQAEREKLSHRGARLMEAVTGLRDLALNGVQSSVSARMSSIRRGQRSARAALAEKDTFRFLQMYAQVHEDLRRAKAVDQTRGLEPGPRRDQLVREVAERREQVMLQEKAFWDSLLTMVDPEQETPGDTARLVFSPLSMNQATSVSTDNRKVFCNRFLGECGATLRILSSVQSDPKCHTWLISLSKDVDWTIGLRNQKPVEYLDSSYVFGLVCNNKELSCVTPGPHLIFSALPKHQESEEEMEARYETVEVFWNVAASSLSFFRRARQHPRREIATVEIGPNDWDLAPFVQLGKMDIVQRKESQVIAVNSRKMRTKRRNPQPQISEVVCELL